MCFCFCSFLENRLGTTKQKNSTKDNKKMMNQTLGLSEPAVSPVVFFCLALDLPLPLPPARARQPKMM